MSPDKGAYSVYMVWQKVGQKYYMGHLNTIPDNITFRILNLYPNIVKRPMFCNGLFAYIISSWYMSTYFSPSPRVQNSKTLLLLGSYSCWYVCIPSAIGCLISRLVKEFWVKFLISFLFSMQWAKRVTTVFVIPQDHLHNKHNSKTLLLSGIMKMRRQEMSWHLRILTTLQQTQMK